MTKEGYCPGGDKAVALDKRRMVRCSVCNRRLLATEYWFIDGDEEDVAVYTVPPHKVRTFQKKAPKRKRKLGRRCKK